jgi:hypothetical protein
MADGDDDPAAIVHTCLRHGAPTRIRQRIPSMSCRLLHFGGRPACDRLPDDTISLVNYSAKGDEHEVTYRRDARAQVARSTSRSATAWWPANVVSQGA